jgi:hypothetical protein
MNRFFSQCSRWIFHVASFLRLPSCSSFTASFICCSKSSTTSSIWDQPSGAFLALSLRRSDDMAAAAALEARGAAAGALCWGAAAAAAAARAPPPARRARCCGLRAAPLAARRAAAPRRGAAAACRRAGASGLLSQASTRRGAAGGGVGGRAARGGGVLGRVAGSGGAGEGRGAAAVNQEWGGAPGAGAQDRDRGFSIRRPACGRQVGEPSSVAVPVANRTFPRLPTRHTPLPRPLPPPQPGPPPARSPGQPPAAPSGPLAAVPAPRAPARPHTRGPAPAPPAPPARRARARARAPLPRRPVARAAPRRPDTSPRGRALGPPRPRTPAWTSRRIRSSTSAGPSRRRACAAPRGCCCSAAPPRSASGGDSFGASPGRGAPRGGRRGRTSSSRSLHRHIPPHHTRRLRGSRSKGWTLYKLLLGTLAATAAHAAAYLAYASAFRARGESGLVTGLYLAYVITDEASSAAFLGLLLLLASGYCITRSDMGQHRGKVLGVPAVYLVTGLITDIIIFKVGGGVFGGRGRVGVGGGAGVPLRAARGGPSEAPRAPAAPPQSARPSRPPQPPTLAPPPSSPTRAPTRLTAPTCWPCPTGRSRCGSCARCSTWRATFWRGSTHLTS